LELKKTKLSLYTLVAIVLFVTMLLTMSIQTWYNYNDVKDRLDAEIKQNAKISSIQIEKSIAPYIHAFSMDEYLNIIENEMEHQSIFAVIIEDHKLGKVLGKEFFSSGKIRNEKWEIVDFEPEDPIHLKTLKTQYYTTINKITDQNNELLANIFIYSTNRFMEKRLQHVIVRDVVSSLFIYVIFLGILFIVLHLFLLKPILSIVTELNKTDKHNIPKDITIDSSTNEIYTLTRSLSTMIQTIKESRRIQSDQKKELQMIFDYSRDGIFIMDLESRFLHFNSSYLEMTGYTKEELLSKTCLELTLSTQRDLAIKAIQELIERKHIENFEKICISKDGKQLNVNLSMVLLPDGKRILATAKDMTHVKMVESQSKLIAMGEMIGNIAHQWRQPLSVISTGASGAKVKKKMGVLTDEDFNESMDMIVKQTQYLSQTIDDFRDFIKSKNEQKTFFNLDDTLEKTLNIIDASLSNNYIKVKKDLQSKSKIEGYQNELIQAFINILNNSKDILKQNVQNEQERYIFITTKDEREHTVITIKDTGGGIPSTNLSRIFEPYFTTKHQSVGTGIGLYMTRDIIMNHHNGIIEATNDSFMYEGKEYTGALFSITFSSASLS